MKALKIDVVKKEVYEVEVSDIKNICEHIGNGCSLFCVPVGFPNGDALYADDESLLRENIQGCFIMPGWKIPIVGNAIILGTDKKGNSIDNKSTVDEIIKNIVFGSRDIAEKYRGVVMDSPFNFSFCAN